VSRLRSLGYLGGGPPGGRSGADPKDRLDEYRRYGRAVRLANSGQFAAAIAEFEKVLQENDRNAPAHFYLAVCEFRLGRLDEAVISLEATLKASPNYVPAQELLGSIWLLKKDYLRARKQFANLAATAPGNYGAHYNLGLLSMREGRLEEAMREFQSAAQADATSAQPHSALGSLYYERGDWNRARDELRQAIALDPKDEASRKMLDQLGAKHP
jgi:tetratricopeptide (TPR) repeat protein